MVGCCRLPFGTASRSVRVLLKVPCLHYVSPLPRPSVDEKTRSITVPVVVPASINFDLALANSNFIQVPRSLFQIRSADYVVTLEHRSGFVGPHFHRDLPGNTGADQTGYCGAAE